MLSIDGAPKNTVREIGRGERPGVVDPPARLLRTADVLLTNHLAFGSTTIAAICKYRWEIELFFRALKQTVQSRNFGSELLELRWLAGGSRHSLSI